MMLRLRHCAYGEFMMHRRCCLVLIAVLLASVAAADTSIDTLRCEYRVDPLGMDVAQPRLSWLMRDDRRGARQTAFRIVVASTPERLAQDQGGLWDSGRIASDASNQIEYAGTPLVSRQRCHWKVRIWDQDGRPSDWSTPACWSMGLLVPDDWRATWIGAEALPPPTAVPPPAAVQEPAPKKRGKPLSKARRDAAPRPLYLRKAFALDQPIRRATAYVTALGLYELRLNGTRVGDHLLAPEWTDYHKRVQYQTYDVTSLIRPGANAIGAILGNGWYCGDWQKWQAKLSPIYGIQPYLLAQLEIERDDGSLQVVATDGSWRVTDAGPMRFSGIFEGETYDARLEMPGWDTATFADLAWQPATVATPTVGALVWQRSEPIRVTQEITPIAVTEPKPGVYVFDLGQNIAGWCRLKVQAAAGTTLTLLHNEVLNPDGTVYMDNLHAGHLSQGDRQIVRYTCRGQGEEIFEPHFTYQGFRYVEVRGLTAPPPLDLITGRVFHTSYRQTGTFTCSNDELNRLALNIHWSMRANLMGVPTDCCQRDERCGYTGDMNFFMPTAISCGDVAAFFSKWLVDIVDAQQPDGHFTDHAPTFGPGDGYNTGWADAGIICVHRMWQASGDVRVIRDHYAAMRRMLAFLKTQITDGRHSGKIGNGDWLNLDGGADNPVIGLAYDAYDFRLMAEMAEAIGEARDAAEYRAEAERLRQSFISNYIDAEGRIAKSSQTGFALAFTMGLVPDERRQLMSMRFAEEITRFHDHLATGFIGTPRLLPGLHLAGRDDLAYRLLLQEDFPSWIYQVRRGATTMWERWNGIKADGTFADSGMNSFNHYAFGAVGEYLYGCVGGISGTGPGFKALRIAPVLGEGLTWAKASYDSIHGSIVSAWKREGTTVTMEVTVPANTTATVEVPARDAAAVMESGKPAGAAAGVRFVRMDRGVAVFAVESGTYRFQSSLPDGGK